MTPESLRCTTYSVGLCVYSNYSLMYLVSDMVLTLMIIYNHIINLIYTNVASLDTYPSNFTYFHND